MKVIEKYKEIDEVECNMCGNIMSLLEDESIYVCFNSECTSCYEEEFTEHCSDCHRLLENCTCIEDAVNIKQETLEEAAERYEETDFNTTPTVETAQMMIQRAFINGAKWQQERMYSEEEVEEYLDYYETTVPVTIKQWFEQFKKK